MKKDTSIALAQRVVDILDKKCRNGSSKEFSSWIGYENGNGTECGTDIEKLIKQAKRILKSNQNKQ